MGFGTRQPIPRCGMGEKIGLPMAGIGLSSVILIQLACRARPTGRAGPTVTP